MSNVWGNDDGGVFGDLDEFRLQNELAQLMQAQKQPEEEADGDSQSDSNESNSDSQSIQDSNDVLQAKTTHLMSTLTQSTPTMDSASAGAAGFLKSPETGDIDTILTRDNLGKTQVDGLMQLAEPTETIETTRKVMTSPNRRKVQMLRSRRFHSENQDQSQGAVNDPLSAPLETPPGEVVDEQLTRKSQLISAIDGPLFNIDKADVLKAVKEAELVGGESTEAQSQAEAFDIIVGDPLTVGDFPNTHTIYTITTKTSSSQFDHGETVVTRRYRDFLWLYERLLNNHPGCIIPPPPEKQMVNRFDSKFIENRRMALEGMLQHVAANGVLQTDPAFVLFLQSSDFTSESSALADGSPIGLTDDDYEIATMADLMNSMVIIGESPASAGGSGGGFFSSLIGGLQAPKYVETDEFILAKQEYVDQMDEQLRQLAKSLDMILEKRDELQVSLEELVVVIGQMSDLEVNADITQMMTNFEELQRDQRELLERTNISQVLTFGNVIDEYIRVIGSIRSCFDNRGRVSVNIVSLEHAVEKQQRRVEKQRVKGGMLLETAMDELSRMKTLLDKQKEFQKVFNTNFKRDLAAFEVGKTRAMKNMVEIFWEGLIENQKHSIELWEAFYDKCKFNP